MAACSGGGGGGGSAPTPAPTVTSFAPTTGGAGTSVTVTGTDFTGATAVTFNAVAATSFSVASATSITAVVPAAAGTGPVRVTTPGGTAASSANFTFIEAPAITSFAPATGGAGTTVTLTGTHLTGATAVSFNGTAGTGVTVISDTQVSAVVPSGVTSGPITVTTPGGTATSTGSFTYVAAPAITSFTPTSGTAGATVTVTGTNLTGATAVSFNSVAATSFAVASATSVTAVVPASAGTGRIRITTPGGTATSASNFTYTTPIPAPTLTSFTPTSGATGASVVLTGTNLTGATAVTFGSTAAASFTVDSATQITAVVGAGATGTVSVTTAGGTATSSGTFTFIPAPTITSFTPASGGASASVTITGTNFTGATAVRFGGTNAASYSVDSATQITASVGAGATGAVTVVTPGGTATSSGNFTFIAAPAITSFTPGTAGAGASVVVTGTNLTGATAVRFGGTNAASYNVDSATQITAVVGTGTTGAVTVVTPGGTATSAGTFTFVPAPTITSFTPDTAAAGASVVLTGTNFTGATAVTFGGTAATSYNVDSATQITAVVATGTTGTVVVTTPGGVATSSGTFTFIPAPAVTSFTPTSGGNGTSVVVTGTGFTDATAVTFGGTAATSFVVDSAIQITAVVAAGTTGKVVVTTPGGTGTSTGDFTFIPAPGLTSFTPAYGWPGETITLTGTNFTGATAVTFNSIAAASFSVASATSITAVVPAGATSGTIEVTTPGGAASSASSFKGAKLSVLAGWPSGVGYTEGTATGANLARFNQPLALTFDAAGNLYVADYDNNTVRKIDTTGLSTTVAGQHSVHGTADGIGSAARFWGPAGLAVDDVNKLLYVADAWNSTIRTINIDPVSPNYGEVKTLAGVAGSYGYTATTFDFGHNGRPVGMALSGDGGTLYVTDQAYAPNVGTTAHVVRAVNTGLVSGTAGDISLVAGTPGTTGDATTGSFNLPLGLARIGTDLFVADYNNNAIRRIELANSNALSTLTLTGDSLDAPAGLATDGTDLYVANYDGCTIAKVAVTGGSGVVATLAGTDPLSGYVDADGAAARFTYPGGLAVSPVLLGTVPAGSLFVADFGTNTIRTVDVNSPYTVARYTGEASNPGRTNGDPTVPGLMNNPTSIAVDWTAGKAYVADTSNRMVRSVDLATGVLANAYDNSLGLTFSPVSVALGPTGTLYVADGGTGTQAIYTLNPATGVPTQVTNAASFTSLKGIAVSPVQANGSDVLFATDATEQWLRGVINDGADALVTLASGFGTPYQITVNQAGTAVYVADASFNGVYAVSGFTPVSGNWTGSPASNLLAGSATHVSGYADGAATTAALLFAPNAVAIDNAGTVYVADMNNQALRVVKGGQVSTLVGVGGLSANVPFGSANLPLPASLSFPVAVAARPDQDGTGTQVLIVVADAVLAVGF